MPRASEDQAHLIAGIDHITRVLGGVAEVWRFDRMATVCHPAIGKVTVTFAAVAKHYGVSVATCPPRRGDREGVVGKAVHSAAQRVWGTMPDDVTVESAPAALDRSCGIRGDARRRAASQGTATTVRALAGTERLGALPPVPFPAHRSGTEGPGPVAGGLASCSPPTAGSAHGARSRVIPPSSRPRSTGFLHRSVILDLEADSYRLRAHQARADTLRRTTRSTPRPLR